jgi:glycerate kinase
MKFVFASDSFTGTLTSARIAELLTTAAHEFFPDCETVGIPVADGSLGTVDVVTDALGGEKRTVTVHNPFMEEISAAYGIYTVKGDDGTSSKGAVIEMSAASGITLVPGDRLNPKNTTTYGTGELIRDALEQGCSSIMIAIGSSATNDAGIGALRALGVKFFDENGRELGTASDDNPYPGGTGADLANIYTIDMSGLCPGIRETEITVLCNVDNPLTGPDGATFTFAKQKCSPDMDTDYRNEIISELEAGMIHYSNVLNTTFGADPNTFPGAGAAGGLGATLCIALGAKMSLGSEAILSILDIDSHLKDADLCITGEGRLDWQSFHGKTVAGVAHHCRANNVPLVAIVGTTGEGYEAAYELGVKLILKTAGDGPAEKSMMNPEEYYLRTARAYFQAMQHQNK